MKLVILQSVLDFVRVLKSWLCSRGVGTYLTSSPQAFTLSSEDLLLKGKGCRAQGAASLCTKEKDFFLSLSHSSPPPFLLSLLLSFPPFVSFIFIFHLFVFFQRITLRVVVGSQEPKQVLYPLRLGCRPKNTTFNLTYKLSVCLSVYQSFIYVSMLYLLSFFIFYLLFISIFLSFCLSISHLFGRAFKREVY